MEKDSGVINFPEEILESLEGTILGEVYRAIKAQDFIDSEVMLSDDDKEIGDMIPYEKALRKAIIENQKKIENLSSKQDGQKIAVLQERREIFEALLYHSIRQRLAEKIKQYPHLDLIVFRHGFKIALRESIIKIILMEITCHRRYL